MAVAADAAVSTVQCGQITRHGSTGMSGLFTQVMVGAAGAAAVAVVADGAVPSGQGPWMQSRGGTGHWPLRYAWMLQA